MLSVGVGQPVYLVAASSRSNVVSNPRWFVNSPDATISPGPQNEIITMGSNRVGTGVFTATKPGIYTIQAQSGLVYSEPLVLIVGADQLSENHSLAVASQVNGVTGLPSNLPVVATGSDGEVSYKKYQAINGWLPVSGTVSGVNSIVVLLTNGSDEWTYRVPVVNGQFAGMVRIPFTGSDISVSFIPNFDHTLMTRGNISYTEDYLVSNNVPMTRKEKALLASAEMDMNMSSEFAAEASILMDNAPSLRTGIAAINNYAGEKIVYDWPDYNAGKAVWYDALTEWTHPLGVCQQIAEMAATMLKSIGIPTETILGAAPQGNVANHEWLQAYNGSTWELLDPTWDTPNLGQDMTKDILTNEYNDNSPDFQSSHTYIGVGAWQ